MSQMYNSRVKNRNIERYKTRYQSAWRNIRGNLNCQCRLTMRQNKESQYDLNSADSKKILLSSRHVL